MYKSNLAIDSKSVNKIGLWLCVGRDKGGGVKEVAVSRVKKTIRNWLLTTLFMEVFYGYYMLVRYIATFCAHIANIFYSKKVQEIKKNGYAAATKVLCLYLHFWPLLAIISLHSFHIHFPTTSRIMLQFWCVFFILKVNNLWRNSRLLFSKFEKKIFG